MASHSKELLHLILDENLASPGLQRSSSRKRISTKRINIRVLEPSKVVCKISNVAH